MIDILLQLLLFTSKAIIVVALILILLVGILALLSRGKDRLPGQLRIKNLNENYKVTKESLLHEILSKENLKKFLKAKKKYPSKLIFVRKIGMLEGVSRHIKMSQAQV